MFFWDVIAISSDMLHFFASTITCASQADHPNRVSSLYVDIFSHYLPCQLTCAYPLPRQNALGNLSACTELESLLGSTPADSKVQRHDSDVELNLSNYAVIFCSYASS